MRSFVLIFATVVVLVAGFCVYAYFQPARAARPAKTLSATMPTPAERPRLDQSLHGIGSGDKGWLIKYDEKGDLASKSRGEHYEPQKDGTVNVTQPQADFFMSDNGVPQRLRVEGSRGNVVMDLPPDERPGKANFQNTKTGTPSR